MADPVSEAIVSLLRSDPTLAALLNNTYQGETAVFATDPVPDGADLPYIQTTGQSFDNRNLNMDGKFRQLTRSVRVFYESDGDPGPIEDVALRVRELVTDLTLNVAGNRTVFVDPSGPVVQDPDPDSYGRTVTFEIWLHPTT